MLVSRREEEEEVEVQSMNRDPVGGVKAGREVSVGQLKVLMGILREQNHSHRWFRRLYLVANNEGKRALL